MITVYYSSAFKKAIKKYSSHRKQIEKRIGIFIENPYDLRLKTHKLSGELEGYYSFSISYNLRVLFEFIDDRTVGFIDLGTHGVYKK
jgi:mRNA-degrading endonuclease YafQ of YafQ-DinJ toxin-antitoxin module